MKNFIKIDKDRMCNIFKLENIPQVGENVMRKLKKSDEWF